MKYLQRLFKGQTMRIAFAVLAILFVVAAPVLALQAATPTPVTAPNLTPEAINLINTLVTPIVLLALYGIKRLAPNGLPRLLTPILAVLGGAGVQLLLTKAGIAANPLIGALLGAAATGLDQILSKAGIKL